MVSIYKFLSKLLTLLSHLMSFLQIVFSILIFLTAGYWFCSLIGNGIFNFAEPLAAFVINIIHNFYHQKAQIGDQSFDGSLLLFDLIMAVLIVICAKSKVYLIDYQVNADKEAKHYQEKVQAVFNETLKKEADTKIKKYSDYAILVEFELKDFRTSNLWGKENPEEVKRKQEETFVIFNNALAILNSLQTSKTDNKMLIMAKDIGTFDRTLNLILGEIAEIKKNLKLQRWMMHYYITVELCANNESVTSVFPDLKRLIDLRLLNETVCMSNFRLRYEMLNRKSFAVVKKGHYDIDDDNVIIWEIIKKK